MGHPTTRATGRLSSLLVTTTLIRALILPTPLTADAVAALVVPLPAVAAETGRGVEVGTLPLATIGGNAILNPAMPVTEPSLLPVPRTLHATARILAAPRARVPAGTTFRILATAYSSTRDQTDSNPFITASGAHVHDGTIAVNFLPIGTKVTFPDYAGDKVYSVEDRHAKRLSDRADLWFPTHAAAMEFGVRTLRMVVVE